MHRNVKSIVKGIAEGIGDTGLIHDLPCSSLTFAEGLSAALRPPEAMTVPDHEAIQCLRLSRRPARDGAHIRQPIHQLGHRNLFSCTAHPTHGQSRGSLLPLAKAFESC